MFNCQLLGHGGKFNRNISPVSRYLYFGVKYIWSIVLIFRKNRSRTHLYICNAFTRIGFYINMDLRTDSQSGFISRQHFTILPDCNFAIGGFCIPSNLYTILQFECSFDFWVYIANYCKIISVTIEFRCRNTSI